MMFVAGETANHLQLEEFIGQGAFGAVFRAKHLLLNRSCAVKFVPSKNPREFKEHLEGQILERCRHDNVVDVFDVDIYSKGGVIFAGIEMEFIPLGSVENVMKSKYFSLRSSIKAVIDVLFALEHAHANGILHRDIKPPNIMIGPHGAKISDFGIAASVDASKVGSANGTPIYSAPEVFTGNKTDLRTEVFSVGMSFFQLCNGYAEWPEAVIDKIDIDVIKAGKTIEKIGFEEFVPRRLRSICNKACNENPDSALSNCERDAPGS